MTGRFENTWFEFSGQCGRTYTRHMFLGSAPPGINKKYCVYVSFAFPSLFL